MLKHTGSDKPPAMARDRLNVKEWEVRTINGVLAFLHRPCKPKVGAHLHAWKSLLSPKCPYCAAPVPKAILFADELNQL